MPFTGASAKRTVLRIRDANTRSPKFSSSNSIASLACKRTRVDERRQDAFDVHVGIEVLADHRERVLELDQTAHRQIFALDGDDHLVRGGQRVDRQQPEARRRVDADEVVVLFYLLQRLLKRALSPDHRRHRDLGAGEVDRRAGDVDLARADHVADRDVVHEHVVHRLLERVRVDSLRHRQVALGIHVDSTARGGPPRRRPRRDSAWSLSWRRRPSGWRTRSPGWPSREAPMRRGNSYAPVFAGASGILLPSRSADAPRMPHRGEPSSMFRAVPGLIDKRLCSSPARAASASRPSRSRSACSPRAAVCARSSPNSPRRSASSRAFDQERRPVPGARARPRPVHDLDRPPARDGGVPEGQGRTARPRARREPAVPRVRDGDARGCASCSASARSGSSRSSSARPAAPPRTTSSSSTRRRPVTASGSSVRRGRSRRSPASARSRARDGRSRRRSPTRVHRRSSRSRRPRRWPSTRRCRSVRGGARGRARPRPRRRQRALSGALRLRGGRRARGGAAADELAARPLGARRGGVGARAGRAPARAGGAVARRPRLPARRASVRVRRSGRAARARADGRRARGRDPLARSPTPSRARRSPRPDPAQLAEKTNCAFVFLGEAQRRAAALDRAAAHAPARNPDSIAPSMNPPSRRRGRIRRAAPALGPLHRRVVVLVPAGAVDRPRPARELVGEPVVGGRVERPRSPGGSRRAAAGRTRSIGRRRSARRRSRTRSSAAMPSS